MDIILSLKSGKPFWNEKKYSVEIVQTSHKNIHIKQYILEPVITSRVLPELIFFAYHKKCQLNSDILMSMMMIGAQFEIASLVHYCLAYLMDSDHCTMDKVIKAFELASQPKFHNKPTKAFFQKYIEDHFEQV